MEKGKIFYNTKTPVRIKIFGIGGAGGNAVNRIIEAGMIDLNQVEIISMNTDVQALSQSKAIPIQLGIKTTKGQGSGGRPEIGRQAAEESIDTIKELLANTDMLFLTCGMGKGTGTGATPVIAKIAKEMNILTVGIVTTPFKWEGQERAKNAQQGILELKKYVDALLAIPNDKFIDLYPNFDMEEVFYKIADDVLNKAVLSIWKVITEPGFMNVDFADAKNVLKDAGEIIMTVGASNEESGNVLKQAIKNALNNPLLDNLSIQGAKRILVNICGKGLVANDVNIAGEYIQKLIAPDAAVFVGFVTDARFHNKVEVIIIASGLSLKPKPQVKREIFARNSSIPNIEDKENKFFVRRGLRVLK